MRYVHLPAAAVDIPLLEDATRRGERPPALLQGCEIGLSIGESEAEAQGGKGR